MNNTMILKEIEEQSKVVVQCYKKNKDIISLIARTIKAFNPNNILIVGNGSSKNSAYYAKYLFEIYYNIPVSIISTSIYTNYNNSLNLKKSIVIAISQSGNNKDILEVCKCANESGAITLSITNNEKSLISNECKYDLYNNVGNEIPSFPIKSFTTTIYLLTKLLYEITSIPELDIDEDRVSESLHNSLKYYDQIKKDCSNFIKEKEIISLYSGYSIGLSKELSYKLTKDCNKISLCLSTNDIYSNNINLINKDIPIIILAIDKNTNNDINNNITRIKNLGNYTYVITNIGEILNNSIEGINILEDNDLYAIFTSIGIIQLITYELKKRKDSKI